MNKGKTYGIMCPTPKVERRMKSLQSITDKILALKKERKAVILAHNYQNGDIQDLADFVGDSFALSRTAKDVANPVIVFCGVHFMAESAKLLSPQKTVLLPVLEAGCPMADMVTAQDIRALRQKHPDAAFVCYVNSSAEVKAECDICCTSANAVRVVKSLPQKKIVFVPDENLGRYVAKQLPEKEVILFPGFCPTHHHILLEEIKGTKASKPGVPLLAHPECKDEVLAHADFIGSTSAIIKYAKETDYPDYLIATEEGILHQLKKDNPQKNFSPAISGIICPNMKKTTLQDVFLSLEKMQFEIKLDEKVIEKAKRTLDRMLEVG